MSAQQNGSGKTVPTFQNNDLPPEIEQEDATLGTSESFNWALNMNSSVRSSVRSSFNLFSSSSPQNINANSNNTTTNRNQQFNPQQQPQQDGSINASKVNGNPNNVNGTGHDDDLSLNFEDSLYVSNGNPLISFSQRSGALNFDFIDPNLFALSSIRSNFSLSTSPSVFLTHGGNPAQKVSFQDNLKPESRPIMHMPIINESRHQNPANVITETTIQSGSGSLSTEEGDSFQHNKRKGNVLHLSSRRAPDSSSPTTSSINLNQNHSSSTHAQIKSTDFGMASFSNSAGIQSQSTLKTNTKSFFQKISHSLPFKKAQKKKTRTSYEMDVSSFHGENGDSFQTAYSSDNIHLHDQSIPSFNKQPMQLQPIQSVPPQRSANHSLPEDYMLLQKEGELNMTSSRVSANSNSNMSQSGNDSLDANNEGGKHYSRVENIVLVGEIYTQLFINPALKKGTWVLIAKNFERFFEENPQFPLTCVRTAAALERHFKVLKEQNRKEGGTIFVEFYEEYRKLAQEAMNQQNLVKEAQVKG